MTNRTMAEIKDLPRQRMDMDDLSRLRMIARLENRNSHASALALAKNLKSSRAKQIAEILLQRKTAKARSGKRELRTLAAGLLESVK